MNATRIGLAPIGLALLGLIGLALPAAAKLPAKEYRDLKKELQEAVEGEKWETATEKVKAIAKDDTKKTFKLLLKLAEKFPLDLAGPLGESLPGWTDDAALKEARKAFEKSKVLQVRRALALGFAERKEYGPLIEALDDKDEDFVYGIIQRLLNARVDEAVGPLIDLAEKKEKDKESGTWIELRAALAELLGQDCPSAADYRDLWKALESQGGLKAATKLGERVQTGGAKKDVGGSQVREFFGRSISSSRVVFILDTSGSMVEKDRPRRRRKPTRQPRKGPVTGAGSEGGDAAQPDADKPDPDKPKPILTRLRRAQDELIKVIDNLDPRVRINIVAFSGPAAVRVWREGRLTVHPLTPANRKSAKEFVEQFVSTGATATDKALEKAYEIDGARAFYLLSDGEPSHGGGRPLPVEEVYKVIRAGDRGRGITIHTMGFRGANVEFMNKLAAMTGGRYSDIPDQDQ